MNPAPSSNDVTKHLLDLADYAVRLVATLGALWVGVAKIAKPYTAWRRRHFAEIIKDVLSTELEQLGHVVRRDDRLHDLLERIYNRQERIFEEMDLFHAAAVENHERLDEINVLLDALGFTSDRRSDVKRRERVEELLTALKERQIARARAQDEIAELDVVPPIAASEPDE